jgi:biopolymer transport protein ExbD
MKCLSHFDQSMEQGVPLTPMIDVVFLLLIFFLLTAEGTIVCHVDVTLPSVANPEPLDATPDNLVTVSITRAGQWFLGDGEVSDRELLVKIRETERSGSRPVVIVHADGEVAHRHVASLLNFCSAQGVSDFSVVVKGDNE